MSSVTISNQIILTLLKSLGNVSSPNLSSSSTLALFGSLITACLWRYDSVAATTTSANGIDDHLIEIKFNIDNNINNLISVSVGGHQTFGRIYQTILSQIATFSNRSNNYPPSNFSLNEINNVDDSDKSKASSSVPLTPKLTLQALVNNNGVIIQSTVRDSNNDNPRRRTHDHIDALIFSLLNNNNKDLLVSAYDRTFRSVSFLSINELSSVLANASGLPLIHTTYTMRRHYYEFLEKRLPPDEEEQKKLIDQLEKVLPPKDHKMANLHLMDNQLFPKLNTPSSPVVTIPSGLCLHHLFAYTACRFPNNTALIDGAIAHKNHNKKLSSGTTSYAVMDKRTNSLARFLRSKCDTLSARRPLINNSSPFDSSSLNDHFLPSDAIVGIFLPRSPLHVSCIIATLKAGAAYLPLDPNAPIDRVRDILIDAGAVALFTDKERAAKLRVGASDKSTIIIEISEADVDGLSPQHRDDRIDVLVKDTDLAYVIYTSGSTGRPKGVCVPHSSAVNLVLAERLAWKVNETDIIYHGFSIAFDASVEELWLGMASGGALMVADEHMIHTGPALADILTELKVTVLSCVPTLLTLLSDTNKLDTIRILITGGEACHIDLIHRWAQGRTFINSYGPTEATVICTYSLCTPSQKSVHIGQPVPSYLSFVVDPKTHMVLPLGVPGELAVGGIGVVRGYLNRPELTAEKFISLPSFLEAAAQRIGYNALPIVCPRLYLTGDLVALEVDPSPPPNTSNLFCINFLGRIDSQVKVRGFRVEVSEIENVLMSIPESNIQTAVVHLRNDVGPDKKGGMLVAYVTLHNNNNVPKSAILSSTGRILTDVSPKNVLAESLFYSRDYQSLLLNGMRARLPHYMIPGHIELCTELPTLHSGKVDRKKLHKPIYYIEQKDDDEEEESTNAQPEGQINNNQNNNNNNPFQVSGPPAAISDVSPIVRRLLKVYAKLFPSPIEPISVQSNFFTLGGHSLLAAHLVTALRKQAVTAHITMGDVYSYATLGALAEHLEKTAPPHVQEQIKREALGVQPGTFANLPHNSNGSNSNSNSLGPSTPLFKAEKSFNNASISNSFNAPASPKTSLNYSSAEHSFSSGNKSFNDSEDKPEEDDEDSDEDDNDTLTNPAVIKRKEKFVKPGTCQYLLCGFFQMIVLYLVFAIPACGLRAPFDIYILMSDNADSPLWLAILVAILSFAVMTPLALIILTWSFKWLLLGRVKPGSHNLWSWFYFRWWIVVRLQILTDMYILAYLKGTSFMNMYMWIMGAKVGRNVYFNTTHVEGGTWDLVSLGDDACVNADAAICTTKIIGGKLHLGRIDIGRRCYIGANATLGMGTKMSDDSGVTVLSMVPESSKIKRKQLWTGSPAKRDKTHPNWTPAYDKNTTTNTGFWVGVGQLLVFILLLPYVGLSSYALCYYGFFYYIPDSAIDFFEVPFSFVPVLYLLAICFLILLCLQIILLKWLILWRLKPGSYPLNSFAYFKIWTVETLIQLNLNVNYAMHSTLFYPLFLRALGVKVGKNTEVSTAACIALDLVELGDGCFIADAVYLGTPTVYANVATYTQVVVRDKSFVGNSAVLTTDVVINEGCLIGVKSQPPTEQIALAAASEGNHPKLSLRSVNSPSLNSSKGEVSVSYSASQDSFKIPLLAKRPESPLPKTLQNINWPELPRECPAESNWLGAKPLFLPQRAAAANSFDSEATYHPTNWLYFQRWFFEFFRVTLPIFLHSITIFVLLAEVDQLFSSEIPVYIPDTNSSSSLGSTGLFSSNAFLSTNLPSNFSSSSASGNYSLSSSSAGNFTFSSSVEPINITSSTSEIYTPSSSQSAWSSSQSPLGSSSDLPGFSSSDALIIPSSSLTPYSSSDDGRFSSSASPAAVSSSDIPISSSLTSSVSSSNSPVSSSLTSSTYPPSLYSSSSASIPVSASSSFSNFTISSRLRLSKLMPTASVVKEYSTSEPSTSPNLSPSGSAVIPSTRSLRFGRPAFTNHFPYVGFITRNNPPAFADKTPSIPTPSAMPDVHETLVSATAYPTTLPPIYPATIGHETNENLVNFWLLLPVAYMVMLLFELLFMVLLKWILMGRYVRSERPLWSRFVWRTELVTGIFEAILVPFLLNNLRGTPFLPVALRLFGTTIGERTYIDTCWVSEFDLVHIGDDVAICSDSTLQTHLFEDRVMKLGTIIIEDKCSLGFQSTILYDTKMGEGSALADMSLLMKGEQLPPWTTWEGIPCQQVHTM